MTQEITIRKKEGDEITFKLRKVESFEKKILDKWNEFGVVKSMVENSNKENGSNEDPNSPIIQTRMGKVIQKIMKETFSKTDLSELPILWNLYEDFKKQVNGKKLIHYDKLNKDQQDSLYDILQSQLFNKTVYPKGVIEGNKYLNNGTESVVTITQEHYDGLIEECKEKGYSSIKDKYGKKSRVELYSDGTLFEPDGVRPIYTLKMVSENNPDYFKEMEGSFEITNKIQKEVWEFYKDNGGELFEFMEKCWSSKMESFHMLFEKDYGKKDKSGKREYHNLDGIRPLCEYLGFEILSDDSLHFLPIDIPKGTPKDFKLFKYFPNLEKMYNELDGEGIRFMVTPTSLLDGLIDYNERSETKEKELVG